MEQREAMGQAATPATSALRLKRALGLWDLVLYGVIVIQPVAPMSVYGVLSERGRGHAVTTILVAMVAMLFTAISYGRMARVYPSAGSAFTYVGHELRSGRPLWGLDGVLLPVVHGTESARGAGLGTHQCRVGGGHGSGNRDIFRHRSQIHSAPA